MFLTAHTMSNTGGVSVFYIKQFIQADVFGADLKG